MALCHLHLTFLHSIASTHRMLEKRIKGSGLGNADFSGRGQDGYTGFHEAGRDTAKGDPRFQRAGSEGQSPSDSSTSFPRALWYHQGGMRGQVSQAFARNFLLPVESRLPFEC